MNDEKRKQKAKKEKRSFGQRAFDAEMAFSTQFFFKLERNFFPHTKSQSTPFLYSYSQLTAHHLLLLCGSCAAWAFWLWRKLLSLLIVFSGALSNFFLTSCCKQFLKGIKLDC